MAHKYDHECGCELCQEHEQQLKEIIKEEKDLIAEKYRKQRIEKIRHERYEKK